MFITYAYVNCDYEFMYIKNTFPSFFLELAYTNFPKSDLK